MHGLFAYVLWIVCGAGIVIGVMMLLGSGKTWEDYAERGLVMDRDRRSGAGAGGSAGGGFGTAAERDAEIRQLVEAANARRVRRGQAPLDVEAEISRLTAPAVDPELRGEVRALVEARNARRVRRGEPPLDVESEIERELAALAQRSD